MHKSIKELIKKLDNVIVVNDADINIASVECDSRKVKNGTLFLRERCNCRRT